MYENLPGGDILELGLRSMGKGLVDENSLLLLIGAYRLRQCGVDIRPLEIGAGFPEDRLYQLLISRYGSDAHRMYNSLTRRLVSLENALENLKGHGT